MNNDKFLYVDIPLEINVNTFTYGDASKSSGEILFEMNALEDSELFSSYADMKENYDKDYMVINLLRDVKIPIARITITSVTEPEAKEVQYFLISNVSKGVPFISRLDDSDLTCYCAKAVLTNGSPGIYICSDKSITYDA